MGTVISNGKNMLGHCKKAIELNHRKLLMIIFHLHKQQFPIIQLRSFSFSLPFPHNLVGIVSFHICVYFNILVRKFFIRLEGQEMVMRFLDHYF